MVKMQENLKGAAVYTVLNAEGEKIAVGDRMSLANLLEFNNNSLKKENPTFNASLNNYGEISIVYTGLNLVPTERYLKVLDKKLEDKEVYLVVETKTLVLVGLFRKALKRRFVTF